MSSCQCCDEPKIWTPAGSSCDPCATTSKSCCTKKVKAEYCCKKCKSKGSMVLELDSKGPVYIRVNYIGTLNLLPTILTPVPFNTISSISNINIYNPALGLVTIPPCGDGIYVVSVHVVATAGQAISIFTLSINVNGVPIDSISVTLLGGETQDLILPISGFPLQVGQSLGVTVIASTGGSISGPNTTFSLTRVSDFAGCK